jgi:hypothetical protein
MIHLSGVDASFLHLETPEMPMHVGSLHLLDLPAGYEGDFFEAVVRHISSRLHLASVFERKLAQMPLEMSNPVWIDDDDIDIEYHVRRIVLSKPGTMEQLEAYVGRLHSSLLDRSRPLWEIYVIEGLKSGQVALYAKVHHAAIDGQAGVALARALYDVTPEPRPVRRPRQRARTNQYQLGVAELATAAAQNTLQQYVKLVTTLPNALQAAVSVTVPAFQQVQQAMLQQMLKFNPLLAMNPANLLNPLQLPMPDVTKPNLGLADRLPAGMGFGPRTPLNVSITNQRAFAGRSVSLKETKALAKHAGVSLNDIVMAACATALRRWMKELGERVDHALVAAVPVSLREAGNEDPNNQVTMMLASLATDKKDPIERLMAINVSTTSSKELTGAFKAAIPTDFPSFGAPWIMTGLASLFGRAKVADQMPPIANVAISNVPGIQAPLYMAGALMRSYFPVSIPAHGCALNITVQSYNGSLDYGLTACRRAVPDVADIADYIVEAHAELAALISARPPAPVSDAKKGSGVSLPAPMTAPAPSPAASPAMAETRAAVAPPPPVVIASERAGAPPAVPAVVMTTRPKRAGRKTSSNANGHADAPMPPAPKKPRAKRGSVPKLDPA